MPRGMLCVLFAAGLAAVALGCAGRHGGTAAAAPRPGSELPERFLVSNPSDASPAEPHPLGACSNPLLDPRDGVRIVLVRSAGGYGDYEVPEGRYGVRAGEVLRVECGTGRPIGIVPRPR